jgi:hypothetical protein
MIYLIIGYVVALALVILLYFRYSEFRVKAANESKTISEKYEAELVDLREANNKYLQDLQAQTKRANDVLQEMNDLRKEKENETKLRLNTEKQVELTMQKTKDIEKRIQDWHDAQDAIIDDSMQAILQVGNDLFRKLNESFKEETQNSRNLIGKFTQDLKEFLQANNFEKPSSQSASSNVSDVLPTQNKTISTQLEKLINISKSLALNSAKDFFIKENFDESKKPFMLCEYALIKDREVYLIDFKALNYLNEYEKISKKDKDLATKTLKQRLDKYFLYLTNAKYQQSILKILPSRNVAKKPVKLVFLLEDAKDLELIKNLGYLQKAQNSNIAVFDSNHINDILL